MESTYEATEATQLLPMSWSLAWALQSAQGFYLMEGLRETGKVEA